MAIIVLNSIFMSRGKAYNIWKTKSKYISRLKKQMYFWLVVDDKKTIVTKTGKIVKRWKKPATWRELDEKGGHSKLLKKTSVIYKKHKWEKEYDHQRIKDLRDESKKIIDDELNDDLNYGNL